MSTADAVYWALAETQGDGEWEVRMKWEAEGGRVRGLAGYSRNEKNLAAAHCVLVMRSMCRWGALLLISGGSQAFHARLVRGGQRGHWYWVTAIARGWEGAFRGSAEREREIHSSLLSSCTSCAPLPWSNVIVGREQNYKCVSCGKGRNDCSSLCSTLSFQVAIRCTPHPSIYLVNRIIIIKKEDGWHGHKVRHELGLFIHSCSTS